MFQRTYIIDSSLFLNAQSHIFQIKNQQAMNSTGNYSTTTQLRNISVIGNYQSQGLISSFDFGQQNLSINGTISQKLSVLDSNFSSLNYNSTNGIFYFPTQYIACNDSKFEVSFANSTVSSIANGSGFKFDNITINANNSQRSKYLILNNTISGFGNGTFVTFNSTQI